MWQHHGSPYTLARPLPLSLPRRSHAMPQCRMSHLQRARAGVACAVEPSTCVRASYPTHLWLAGRCCRSRCPLVTGVIPGRGPSPQPGQFRVTLMIAFWRDLQCRCAARAGAVYGVGVGAARDGYVGGVGGGAKGRRDRRRVTAVIVKCAYRARPHGKLAPAAGPPCSRAGTHSVRGSCTAPTLTPRSGRSRTAGRTCSPA